MSVSSIALAPNFMQDVVESVLGHLREVYLQLISNVTKEGDCVFRI